MRYVKYQSQMFCPWPHFESKDFELGNDLSFIFILLFFFYRSKPTVKLNFISNFTPRAWKVTACFFSQPSKLT